ncbi:DUF3883 domain-containing protein [Pseudoduganella sp. FT26W]|uniref:DUF3883 domain-containing protein n=1 Tax=Duganella aquatilis TaxID=2666082 RepID=A0A844D863_9BURK|nr:DUF3883 domain-containing protein [Duganella aquatilis]MRW83750.1 DUF3883 domain-containing protein [Duganella aquatilis]
MSIKPPLPPQQFIERVRRSFLISDDLPEHLQEGALNLQTQLNEALRLLSEDLYSKKTHFVLELIQNADDNSYQPGSTPELTFSITPNRLTLSNNEVGFSEENINAICKVGASSKAKDKQHHIGEKGIGFKSVFSVSNAPEIHSNGFHFRFDRTASTNLLGYVIPTWCEAPDDARPDYTTIVLPAMAGYIFNDATVSDLDARVLLFLNKLRQLTLVQGEVHRLYQRADLNGISQLTTSTTTADEKSIEVGFRYMRVTKTFPMADEFADAKRPDVHESTVTLAFPLDDNGAALLEPASYVFAYLPIHQVGFRFPLHADFILNSGREEVLKDRPWNQRLRDGIAETFVSALTEFKRSSELALTYLRYVPENTDIADDFFGKVRQEIVDRLANEESMKSASGTWHRPSALRLAEKGFRNLFPSAQALSLFGFDYVDPQVQGGHVLLRELGVRDVGPSEILEVFRSHQGWLMEQPLEWRANLYALIAEDLATFVKAGLLKVPCLPTSSGTYVTPAQTTVFFPLGRRKNYGFEHELVVLDGELYDAALERSPEVRELFGTLKVRTDAPYELVVSHILPKHAGDAWKKSKFQALVGHLRYVKDKLSAFLEGAISRGKTHSQAYQMLREGMWIGTKLVNPNGTWTFNRINSLYLGTEYKPDFCIETLIAGEPGMASYVSAAYLSPSSKDIDSEAKSWHDFFVALGVRTSPAVDSFGGNWKSSKELDLLLNASSPTIRRETLECLSRHWSIYSGKLAHNLSAGRNRFVSAETSFARQIREMAAPLRGKKATIPLSESYYMTDELRATLGDGLPYIDAVMIPQMLDDCRVTHHVNAESLIKRLKQLKQNDSGTTKQVQAIYRVLEGRLWESDASFIRQSFGNDGLIQLKGSHKGWFSPSEVSWLTNGQFLDSLYPPIQSLYKDFQGFFIEKLGVPRLLPISKRVKALMRLVEIADKATREAEALAIYKRAEQALKPQFGKEIEVPDWIETFSEEAVFVDHWGEVVGNGDHLFANDSPSLAELFANEEGLSFLAVPSVEVPRLNRLLKAAAVAKLSESVSVEVEGSGCGKIDTDLTSRVRRAVPYIARVLYSRQPEAFERALETGRLTALWNVTVAEVETINLRVRLGEFSRATTADAAMTDVQVLYRTNAKSLKDRVAAELSRYLVETVDFTDTFARILLENDTEGIEEFLGVVAIRHLPVDLERAVRQRELPTKADIEAAGEDAAADDSTPGAPHEALSGSASVTAHNGATVELAKDGGTGTTTAEEEHSLRSASSAQLPSLTKSSSSTSPIPSTPILPGPLVPPLTNRLAGSPNQHMSANESKAQIKLPSTGGMPPPLHDTGSVDSQPHISPTPGASLNGGATSPVAPSFANPPNSQGLSVPSRGAPVLSGSTMRRQPAQTRSGRLLSYVEGPAAPDRQDSREDPAKAAARDAVGRAAVAYVLKTQSKRWASLTEMPHNNPGFDILARDDSGKDEFIEVKGQSGAWTQEGIALTPTELLTAQKMRDRYWLCVVEFAQDEKRRQLHLLKDPFGQVSQFRFDVGWKAIAENVATSPMVPEKGLYIDIDGVGQGRILSVRGKGAFYNVHVLLKDGKQVNSLFHPVKMSLSKEPLWHE